MPPATNCQAPNTLKLTVTDEALSHITRVFATELKQKFVLLRFKIGSCNCCWKFKVTIEQAERVTGQRDILFFCGGGVVAVINYYVIQQYNGMVVHLKPCGDQRILTVTYSALVFSLCQCG